MKLLWKQSHLCRLPLLMLGVWVGVGWVAVIGWNPVTATSRPLCLAWAQQLFDVCDDLQGGQRAAHRGPE